jgi:hypothetical protein
MVFQVDEPIKRSDCRTSSLMCTIYAMREAVKFEQWLLHSHFEGG